jgi:hypothetical protein
MAVRIAAVPEPFDLAALGGRLWAAATVGEAPRACRSLLIQRSRGLAEPVKACRSLLIQRIRPAEPVHSGGSPGPRHGHRPVRRPPSRLTESGGRP